MEADEVDEEADTADEVDGVLSGHLPDLMSSHCFADRAETYSSSLASRGYTTPSQAISHLRMRHASGLSTTGGGSPVD